jgi:hypothetical protein
MIYSFKLSASGFKLSPSGFQTKIVILQYDFTDNCIWCTGFKDKRETD